jgi:NAD-dependent DNA ligase
VIPHIVDISKKSIPSFPSTEYRWNSSGIDIIALLDGDQKSRDEFNIRYLTEFCSKLKILNLGESTISKLYHNGWDTLYKILDSNPESFSCIKGLGQKSSQRIYQSIQNAIPNVTLAQFIGASNVLGQGIAEKKVNMILEAYPNIFTDTTITDVTKIIGDLRGFSKITVSKIAANIDKTRQLVREYDKFFNFYKTTKSKGTVNEGTSTDTRNSRSGFIKVVFTGFRDKELETRIRQLGGVVSDSVTKSVNYVVVKDLETGGSSKIKKAEGYGIKIVDRQFIVEFLNSLG